MVVDNDIPLPGTNQSVNPSNPVESLMTLMLLAVGAGVTLFVMFDAGGEVRNVVGGLFDRVTGTNTSGDNGGVTYGDS